MCAEDAPSAQVVHAMGGRFSISQTYANKGVQLGVDADYDKLTQHLEALQDMSAATPQDALRRRG
jgi:hypothetical protein